MNNLIRNVLIGVAAYYGYTMLANSKDNTKANALRVLVKDIDVDWQRIRVLLQIVNPTSGNIVIRSIVGDLFIDEKKIGLVKTQGYYNIKNNSSLIIPIQAVYALPTMVNQLMAYLNGHTNIKIDFRGTLNLNGSVVPLSISFNYQLPAHA